MRGGCAGFGIAPPEPLELLPEPLEPAVLLPPEPLPPELSLPPLAPLLEPLVAPLFPVPPLLSSPPLLSVPLEPPAGSLVRAFELPLPPQATSTAQNATNGDANKYEALRAI